VPPLPRLETIQMKFIMFVLLTASALWGQSVSTGAWNSQGSAGASSGGNSGGGTSGGGGSSPAENVYCQPGDIPHFGALSDGPALLPTACIYTDLSGSPSPGTTITVSTASALTNALNSVMCGQKIIIQATAAFSGNFTLAARNCDTQHWITIATDQTGNSAFTAQGTRANPCAINQASVANYPSYLCSTPTTLMPTIQTASTNQSVFKAAAGANFYRLTGLNITKVTGTVVDNALIDFSAGADHMIVDRSLIHGVPINCTQTGGVYTCNTNDELKNGISFNNCTFCGVINSWIYDVMCFTGCIDSVALSSGTGSSPAGPLKYYNNLIASAGESWLSGGGGSNPAIPTDFEIRHNHSYKPPSWMLSNAGSGQHPIIKNLGEIKNGNRVLYEGNVFETSLTGWQTDQSGFATLMTPKNQSNATGGNASSDGAGNLVALTGTFSPNVVAVGCSVANHCVIKYGGTGYRAQTWTDATHIVISPAPPVTASASYTACLPGTSGNVLANNITFRYNEIRNTTNGIQLASVLSDCGDPSQGIAFVSIHDNLMHGLNNELAVGGGPQSWVDGLEIVNNQTSNYLHDISYQHNTIAMVKASPFSWSGLGQSLDSTNTVAGGSGAYFSNMVIQNNISPAGWIPTWKAGSTFPGGTLAGLNQQSCPNHDGLNCSYTFTRNIFGTGMWLSQLVNRPYPTSNADTTDSPAGTGCNASGATCFPSLGAFQGLFVNYNNGYLGDYHLAANSPYAGAGSDGQDIGANIDQVLFLTAGARSSTNYTAASITTTTLPNGTVGTPYTLQLAATSASDFQLWSIISGSLPPGLTLSRAGLVSGTPSASVTSSFSVQMMDAVQQYAARTLTLTVN
jgi:hypothetical protein